MAEAPKQYLFVSNRDVVIGSTQGYSIEFLKGEPTHVPRAMHAEVMAKGILPCDAAGNTLDSPQVADPNPEVKVMVAPEDATEREDAIVQAIEAIVKRNKSTDFSAGGVPTSSAVRDVLGWKPDTKEVASIWRSRKGHFLGEQTKE